MSESKQSGRAGGSGDDNERIADAVARLERAVNDLASAAGSRAAEYVERATDRLRENSGDAAGRGGRYHRHRHRREPAWLWSDRPRSAKLYRDAVNGRILGVCSGIARYYGMETWVVRCIAVTGLIFLNWMVFVAYLVTAMILDTGPTVDNASAAKPATADASDDRTRQRADSASPRQRLRELCAAFDEFELRMRRMETHVTSNRYELQRELAKIGAPP